MPSKRIIFARYSTNLEKLDSQLQGKYACPLTLRLFDEASLDKLSLEHCIPNGLGKPCFVLTDIKANNSSGSEIDAHLHRMVKHIELLRDGVGTAATRLKMGNAMVGATFSQSMIGELQHIHFQIEKKTSDPREIESLQRAAELGELPSEMSLFFHPIDNFDQRRAYIALLKAAYLVLFYRLGYSFILNPVFQQIRHQITNPEEDILPMPKIVIVAKENLPGDLFWVKEPKELFAFGCELSLSKTVTSNMSLFRVFLPCSHGSTEAWRTVESGDQTYSFIPGDIDYIENPRVWIEYHPVDEKATD